MSEYVPVTELDELTPETPVRWNFSLPPSIDAERITLNISRLNTLHRIGGVAGSVIYDYQGERTEYTPGITGINADGTAAATTAGAVHKAEETDTNLLELFPPFIQRQYGKVIAAYGLNKAEMVSTISDAVRSGKTDREQIWAQQLDKTLRTSVRKAGRENLITRNPLFIKALDTFWLTSGISVYATDILSQHVNPWDAAFPFAWSVNLGVQLLTNRLQTGDTLIKERRWSMAPNGFQPDRYIALSALSRYHGLVKARA